VVDRRRAGGGQGDHEEREHQKPSTSARADRAPPRNPRHIVSLGAPRAAVLQPAPPCGRRRSVGGLREPAVRPSSWARRGRPGFAVRQWCAVLGGGRDDVTGVHGGALARRALVSPVAMALSSRCRGPRGAFTPSGPGTPHRAGCRRPRPLAAGLGHLASPCRRPEPAHTPARLRPHLGARRGRRPTTAPAERHEPRADPGRPIEGAAKAAGPRRPTR
jgi:hypothetical protein